MSHYDYLFMERCPLHYATEIIGGKRKVHILCAVSNAGTDGAIVKKAFPAEIKVL